jgi:hypothetical protein
MKRSQGVAGRPDVKKGRNQDEIVEATLRILERSSKLIAYARYTTALDERCFEGTRKAIARSREVLNPAISTKRI